MTISALGAIGAWYIGANSYIGIKDEEYRQVAIGTGIGTVFEAGAGAMLFSRKLKDVFPHDETHDLKSATPTEITFQGNKRLGEQEIELQKGESISLTTDQPAAL